MLMSWGKGKGERETSNELIYCFVYLHNVHTFVSVCVSPATVACVEVRGHP